jgi:hypothetical protein
MHRAVLLILVTLIALRGLVGDAMASQMQNTRTAQAHTVMAAQHRAPQDTPSAMAAHPCHGASQASDNADMKTDNGCMQCQVCHMAVTHQIPAARTVLAASGAAPTAHRLAWLSAHIPSLTKPPIV